MHDELTTLAGSIRAELELLVAAGDRVLVLPPAAPTSALSLPKPATPAPPSADAQALAALEAELQDCTRCALCKGRTRVVFGEGDPNARLMFVGEGPGAEEDRTGRPFVGKAGQLLTRMIGAMGLEREQVYIANVVKCRPPNNRTPLPDEAETCKQFLRQQIQWIQPELIVALGATAARALLGGTAGVARMRNRVLEIDGTPVLVTYHPAYLLRNAAEKRTVWQDLKRAMSFLGLPLPQQP